MSFDLLLVPEGFETEQALVVAPYVDPKFMKELVKRLAPKRLCLLIDDGVRFEDLAKIRKACGRNVNLEIRLGRASGLVHMKAFYFEFARETPRWRKRRLLFGSANATDAAFKRSRNAELIADVDLAIGEDAELSDYFASILAAFDTGDAVEIEAQEIGLSKAPVLYLPRFKTAHPDMGASGFDSWLQRGVLAAQYRNAPQFLTLSIQLRKRLPQDLVAKIFADRRFSEKGNRDVVRYPYLNELEEAPAEETEASKPKWKARYGVWTHLGDWVSDGAYREHQDIMKSQASEARSAKVGELLANKDCSAWKDERRSELLSALSQVWDDLRASGIEPGEYLNGDEQGISFKFYGDRFDQKVSEDILLAQDDDFRKRYINGYEFPDVPRFRQDPSAWESFVRSWCESIAVEAAKTNTLSLMARRIGELYDQENLVLASATATDICKFLRKRWSFEWDDEDVTVGEWIEAYYE